MSPRQLARILGVVVLVSSGAYVFVYLYRWEWNRAMFCLGLFLAVEVALGVGSVLERVGTVSSRLDRLEQSMRRGADPLVLARLRESAPGPSQPFAWLAPRPDQLGVFVPVLMGAGVVLSGLAWLVERLARSTAAPSMERGLASRLGALALPVSLVDDRSDPASLLSPLR